MSSGASVVRFTLPGGSVALLHGDRRHIFVFNRVAHLLWRVLHRGDRACLAPVLSARFGLEACDAARDADAIWTRWHQLGLLAPVVESDDVPPPPAPASDVPARSMIVRVGPLLVAFHAPPQIAAFLCQVWTPNPDETGRPDITFVFRLRTNGLGHVVMGAAVLLAGAEPHALIGAAIEAIIRHLHPQTRFCAYVHAASLAAGDRAIVVAAPSGSGKSTLTAYLVAQGYTFLSDDIVPLRALDHAVVPFPQPISVKPGAAAALKPFYPALQADGGQQTQGIPVGADYLAPPRRARLLLFPLYRAGAETRFEEIGVADALMRLLADRIFFGYPIPPDMVARFIAWLRAVERRVLVYSDFTEAARCIEGALPA